MDQPCKKNVHQNTDKVDIITFLTERATWDDSKQDDLTKQWKTSGKENTGGTKSNCAKPGRSRDFLYIDPYKAETMEEEEEEEEEGGGGGEG